MPVAVPNRGRMNAAEMQIPPASERNARNARGVPHRKTRPQYPAPAPATAFVRNDNAAAPSHPQRTTCRRTRRSARRINARQPGCSAERQNGATVFVSSLIKGRRLRQSTASSSRYASAVRETTSPCSMAPRHRRVQPRASLRRPSPRSTAAPRSSAKQHTVRTANQS